MVNVTNIDCNEGDENLTLSIEVLVEYLDKQETLKETLQLYQGKYHV